MSDKQINSTGYNVDDFIASVSDVQQRTDAAILCELMSRLTGEPATMRGAGIIGFGQYDYRYESGREGSAMRIGFSPRKGQTVIYLIDGFSIDDGLSQSLGKHKHGKSCLYVKRLSDVDLSVLETIIVASLAYLDQKFPKGN